MKLIQGEVSMSLMSSKERRRQRAVDRGYVRSVPQGYKHVLVPCHLENRVRAQVDALALHEQCNRTTRHRHHFLSSALLASRPLRGSDFVRRALRVKKKADACRHDWDSNDSFSSASGVLGTGAVQKTTGSPSLTRRSDVTRRNRWRHNDSCNPGWVHQGEFNADLDCSVHCAVPQGCLSVCDVDFDGEDAGVSFSDHGFGHEETQSPVDDAMDDSEDSDLLDFAKQFCSVDSPPFWFSCLHFILIGDFGIALHRCLSEEILKVLAYGSLPFSLFGLWPCSLDWFRLSEPGDVGLLDRSEQQGSLVDGDGGSGGEDAREHYTEQGSGHAEKQSPLDDGTRRRNKWSRKSTTAVESEDNSWQENFDTSSRYGMHAPHSYEKAGAEVAGEVDPVRFSGDTENSKALDDSDDNFVSSCGRFTIDDETTRSGQVYVDHPKHTEALGVPSFDLTGLDFAIGSSPHSEDGWFEETCSSSLPGFGIRSLYPDGIAENSAIESEENMLQMLVPCDKFDAHAMVECTSVAALESMASAAVRAATLAASINGLQHETFTKAEFTAALQHSRDRLVDLYNQKCNSCDETVRNEFKRLEMASRDIHGIYNHHIRHLETTVDHQRSSLCRLALEVNTVIGNCPDSEDRENQSSDCHSSENRNSRKTEIGPNSPDSRKTSAVVQEALWAQMHTAGSSPGSNSRKPLAPPAVVQEAQWAQMHTAGYCPAPNKIRRVGKKNKRRNHSHTRPNGPHESARPHGSCIGSSSTHLLRMQSPLLDRSGNSGISDFFTTAVASEMGQSSVYDAVTCSDPDDF